MFTTDDERPTAGHPRPPAVERLADAHLERGLDRTNDDSRTAELVPRGDRGRPLVAALVGQKRFSDDDLGITDCDDK